MSYRGRLIRISTHGRGGLRAARIIIEKSDQSKFDRRPVRASY
jgi:hypothetical protein